MRDYYTGVLSTVIPARQEAGLTQREVSLSLAMAHPFTNKCESGEGYRPSRIVGHRYALWKPVTIFALDDH